MALLEVKNLGIYFGGLRAVDGFNITIEKGSITINGTSLTVVNSGLNTFSVAIIPYTFDHTNFNTFKIGTKVNNWRCEITLALVV